MRLNEKYDGNWMSHGKHFQFLDESFEVVPPMTPRTFTMTVDSSAITLFDAHLVTDHRDWTQVAQLFSQQYNIMTKKVEASDKLA